MYLDNLHPGHGFANGSTGTITGIIVDPAEQDQPAAQRRQNVRYLRHPPACVLFRPDWSTAPAVTGLPSGAYPLIAIDQTYSLPQSSTTAKATVSRKQFALIPAYAYTHDKSQGQNINPVIVDMLKPSNGSVKRESYYVALSRSSGASDVALLRDISTPVENQLRAGPCEALRLDDKLLIKQHEDTKAKFEKGCLFQR